MENPKHETLTRMAQELQHSTIVPGLTEAHLENDLVALVLPHIKVPAATHCALHQWAVWQNIE